MFEARRVRGGKASGIKVATILAHFRFSCKLDLQDFP